MLSSCGRPAVREPGRFGLARHYTGHVGDWYTVGLCLGLALGLSVAVTGILGTNVLGIGAAAVVGAAVGVGIGLAIGDTAETVAGVVGGVLGAVAAGVVVTGALRRGATRFGTGAYLVRSALSSASSR